MKYLLHPRGIFTLRISGNTIKKDVTYAISGFFFQDHWEVPQFDELLGKINVYAQPGLLEI